MTNLDRKICLIGDYGVGKTSLIRRFIDRSFSDQYLTTVGVKISRKLVELNPSLKFQLIIWDVEGSTKFKAVSANYLQGAGGAIIVADLTRPETIENIPTHCEQFNRINPDRPIVIALNKCDLLLDKPPQISNAYTTSAKSGEGVDMLFQNLCIKLAGHNL